MKTYENCELESLALHIADIYASKQNDIKNAKDFSRYYFKIYNDILNTLIEQNENNKKEENDKLFR